LTRVACIVSYSVAGAVVFVIVW